MWRTSICCTPREHTLLAPLDPDTPSPVCTRRTRPRVWLVRRSFPVSRLGTPCNWYATANLLHQTMCLEGSSRNPPRRSPPTPRNTCLPGSLYSLLLCCRTCKKKGGKWREGGGKESQEGPRRNVMECYGMLVVVMREGRAQDTN